MSARRGVLAGLWIALFACGPKPATVERDRMLHALDALRDAPTEAISERKSRLADLQATPATTPPAVLARDTCVAAHRLLIEGTEIERALQAELAGDAGPSPSLVPRLLDAERRIKESATLMPDCERAIADLRLGHGAR